jgi:hypothetical protein
VGTYAKSDASGALRQGEILTNFTQYEIDVQHLRLGEIVVAPITHPYVIVLSQDCDLDQDYRRRSRGEQDDLLTSVTFCALTPADQDFRKDVGLASNEWKKFKQNQDPRRHYLRDVSGTDDASGQGLPELAIDFRQYFSISTALAYFALESAQRRCRLEQPYAEHLNNRFSWHISRVALPLDHHLPLPLQPAAEAGVGPAVVDQAAAKGAGVGAAGGEGVVAGNEAPAPEGGAGAPGVAQCDGSAAAAGPFVNVNVPPNPDQGQPPPLAAE